MAIKAVVFDIDGTLYPNRSMMLHSAGFFLSHLRLIRHFSVVRKDLRKVGRIDHFEATQAGMLASRLGCSLVEAEKKIQEILYNRWEHCFRRVRPFKDLKEVLAKLQAQGLRLGILSDFPVGKKLKYFGLENIPWEVVLSSRDSGYLKPSLRPFQFCAEQLKLEPAEVLYVGNNYHYDVVGARKTGMKTAWVTLRRRGRTADIVFKNYREFFEKLSSLL